ncbi:hypothetical protein AeMF1_008820 [Aphanomyces euteiches]|nr:hypothetical protein AeMF1_008820 [Aphanomyces euteiches]KAH9188986.1 hypothetical protein AeNC1_009043 [Aphanomyces euteiches]
MVRRNPRRGGPKTKKRKVTVVPAWTILPTDVIVKIAFFIPDESDLFTFLEALRTFNVLGPLEHLHKLGLKRKHEELWPTLKITPAVLESQFSTLFEAIAKFYSHVVIKDMTDVKWLRKHLNPAVQVEWITDEFPVPQEISDKWTDFRITRLNGDFYSLDSTGLNKCHITKTSPCNCVENSTQITELSIGAYMDDDLNESNLLDISEWLIREPVRKFTFVGTHEWHDIGDAVKQKFFESMINCPIYGRAEVRRKRDLRLGFFEVHIFHEVVRSRLEGSKITDLWVRGYNIREKDAFRSLLQVLPKTSIKHLS